jgi:hypothetical protein
LNKWVIGLTHEDTEKFRTLEDDVLFLQQAGKHKSLSIAEILQVLPGKGRPLILILLSLPFCQPIQIPGLSIPFGLAIAFIGFRMSFEKSLWLPDSLLNKQIPHDTLSTITEKVLSFIKKMKRWVHPRLLWLSSSSFMEKANGLVICLLGLCLALPLPIPLTNIITAWSILLIAFGILEKDGLFILLGYLLSLLTLAFFLIIAISLKNHFSH